MNFMVVDLPDHIALAITQQSNMIMCNGISVDVCVMGTSIALQLFKLYQSFNRNIVNCVARSN